MEENSSPYIKVSPIMRQNYLKVIAPKQPILYTLKKETIFLQTIIINHPKHELKTSKLIRDEFHIEESPKSLVSKEINIASILLKEIALKLEFSVKNQDTIQELKIKIIKEIEIATSLKINNMIMLDDLFLINDNVKIQKQDDTLTLDEFVKIVNKIFKN